jgi:hypothetical protein
MIKFSLIGKLDNLEKAIKFIKSISKEDAESVLKEHQKSYLTTKFFSVQKLGLNKPGSVKHYIETALFMKLNEETFTEEEKIKFAELQLRHSNLFNFIEAVKLGKTDLEDDFEKLFDLCPEGREIKRLKQKAYDFLDESDSQESTSTTYFTRSSYSNKILSDIDIPRHQLVQILFDYQKYVNNTDWRNYIKEKEEIERKKNTKKTFTQRLSMKTL